MLTRRNIGRLMLIGMLSMPAAVAAIHGTDDSSVPETTLYTTAWGVGTFEFPRQGPGDPNTLVVWTETVGPDGKLSRFSGIVDQKSKISVPNIEKFNRKNLSSLNGRLVAAQGRIRQEGRGERTKLYLEEVWILVLE
ncbi:MAG: hypothetical protein HY566_03250 [Candidatus Kerfeldbacteria bacterium]|nr:hypothetical protein [Candidatus Kerfeldbacteria bacterium]